MENKINSFDPLAEMLKKRSDAKKSKIRYVKVDEGSNLNLRSAPGIGNTSLAKMPRGTQVDFTGNKVSLGDKQWAEVEYNGQKGWVDADYLKIDVPEDKTENRQTPLSQTSTSSNTDRNKIDWNDHDALQEALIRLEVPWLQQITRENPEFLMVLRG